MTIGEPRPTGPLRLSRPTFLWRIYPDVTAVALTIDGAAVRAYYDTALQGVVFRPDRPLAPGTHAIHAEAVIAGQQRFVRDWSITVLAGAAASVPTTLSAAEAPLFAAANDLRRRLRLPSFSFDPALRAAAAAHAGYLVRGGRGGHFQDERHPHFIGRRPLDRARTFGFVEDVVAEDIALEASAGEGGGIAEGTAAIENLFAAPYHRIPFLDPGLDLLGVGAAIERRDGVRWSAAVVVFGGRANRNGASLTVVAPGPDERGVATHWRSDEEPDPLRLFGARGRTVGYPLVFAHFAPRLRQEEKPLRLVDLRLADPAGRRVPLWIIAPGREAELRGEAAVAIPREPLRAGTTYTAQVRAFDAAGRDLSRVWSFTTRPGQRSPH